MERAQQKKYWKHAHCERCFRKDCQRPVELTVSCLIGACPNQCGRVFHLCKQEEHMLLCPLEKVPCLNSFYGCPLSMPRYKLAKHLEVCPASVVCCSMAWNRWPTTESDKSLNENLMKEPYSGAHLELAVALKDQTSLFESMKMSHIFPELTEHLEYTELQDNCVELAIEGAVGESTSYTKEFAATSNATATGEKKTTENENIFVGLTQQEREALATDKDVVDLRSYSTWEQIFSKDTPADSHNTQKISPEENAKQKVEMDLVDDETKKNISEEEVKENDDIVRQREMVGFAPWQEGVLERLGKAVTVCDYNMYLVHHGRMLIHFNQLQACTPKEKDFVYGNLEAQELKIVNNFKIPVSYSAKRSHMGDARRKPMSDKSVDTSELGCTLEDFPKWDVIYASLLSALEKELKGHVISESSAVDGQYVCIGTQTYCFDLQPFRPNVVLTELISDRAPGLYLQLQPECVTGRHNKGSSTFTFTCHQFFRRDEYASHFKNIHSDIQSQLSGWFQQRCPLSYLGCTYRQRRFCPSGQKASVIYNQQLGAFAVKPETASELNQASKSCFIQQKLRNDMGSFSNLPFELLQHIAGFLDSFSLSQLAQVSKLMRDVCASLLQERGMVSLLWQKKTYKHGGTAWRARKKIWTFSTHFSTVDNWLIADVPSTAEHLKTCTFYTSDCRQEPFPLTGMHEQNLNENENLVSFFKHM
ncbi:F-box only protein 40 [Protopterus annectens]|uniref:F-box only protein 40 n=1 Tax=Protopterus annectens TaxID=7888 RepID=UPI001CFB2406|nr:F-box only protein 40 [Protopterus annectens]XP_043927010.1 F-box only protein 40 [Protopterus annectens]